ncbi:MAG: TetR/AcrR family transcriptional regulator [Pseudomonadota bacterium]
MRPREFDEQQVIDRLQKAFWSAGFEGLSLEQLTEQTGLSRSSLYNAFGSKSGMMRAAVDCYAARSCERFEAVLAERPIETAIERMLLGGAGLNEAHDDGARRLGCLIGNLIAERAVDPKDYVYLSEKLAQVEGAIESGLAVAQAQGALKPEVATDALSRFLLVQMQGLRLVAKTSADPARLRAAVDLAMTVVRASVR